MAKKLKLVTPKIITETGIDPLWIILGLAAIGFVIYMRNKNGPGTIIEASKRFTDKNNGIGNATPDSSGKTE